MKKIFWYNIGAILQKRIKGLMQIEKLTKGIEEHLEYLEVKSMAES